MDYEKLSEYIPKSTSSWTIDDTCRWLDFIELAQYKSIFCINLSNARFTNDRWEQYQVHQLIRT